MAAILYRLVDSAKLADVEPRNFLLRATRAALENPGTVTLLVTLPREPAPAEHPPRGGLPQQPIPIQVGWGEELRLLSSRAAEITARTLFLLSWRKKWPPGKKRGRSGSTLCCRQADI